MKPSEKNLAIRRVMQKKRLTRKQFDALPPKYVAKYFKIFPKSSFRFTEKTRDAATSVPKKRTPKHSDIGSSPEKDNSNYNPYSTKDKITREEFDKLNHEEQVDYLKKHSKSSKNFRFKPGVIDDDPSKPIHINKYYRLSDEELEERKKKGGAIRGTHFTLRKKNITQKTGSVKVLDGNTTNKEIKDAKAEEAARLSDSRDEAERSLKHGITKESVEAANNITPADLRKTGEGIEKNKKEIVSAIERDMKKTPFLKHSLNVLAVALFDAKPKGLSNQDRRDIMVATAKICKYALIGSAVFAAALGAAPVAFVFARTLLESWNVFNPSGSDREDKEDSEREDKEDSDTQQDSSDASVDGLGDLPSSNLGDISLSSNSVENEETSSKLIDTILVNLSDLLKYTDHEDYIENMESSFGRYFTKYTAESSELLAISYKKKPEERLLPAASCTHWDVFIGSTPVGCIYRETEGEETLSSSVWRIKLYNNFNPLSYPHVYDEDPLPKNGYYVIQNDDPDIEHNLELINSEKTTMAEARRRIKHMLRGN